MQRQIDDVLRDVQVEVARLDIQSIGMVITFTRNDGTQSVLRFGNLWSFLD